MTQTIEREPETKMNAGRFREDEYKRWCEQMKIKQKKVKNSA